MVLAIQCIVILLLVYFSTIFFQDLWKNRRNLGKENFLLSAIIGFVTDFLDTLGIGSFAPTTLLLKVTKVITNDKLIPGTLNVAHCIPNMIESLLFLTIIKVGPTTLLTLVIAAALGSLLGSKVITKLPEEKIQLVIGTALIVTAALMSFKQLGWIAALGQGNTATSLHGIPLLIGFIGNFIFGALMSAGVGIYAPCMAMVYLLGLNPQVAFPIMITSGAALMPIAGREFIKQGQYARKVSLAITIGGLIGVFFAIRLVKNMDMTILTWIIVIVVSLTGISMLKKGIAHTKQIKRS